MDYATSDTNSLENVQNIQNAPSFFMSNKIIKEPTDDDNKMTQQETEQTDHNKIFQMLEEDTRKKEEFLMDEICNQYSQMVVVSQIRKDFTNDDPFLNHLLSVEKAIKKAVRNTLINNKVVESKQWWKDNSRDILRLFYMDINIGFITSTGQIKSTAFVFIHKAHLDTMSHKRLSLQLTKLRIKITLNFIDPHAYIPQKEPPILDSKQAFLQSNKFKNQYIVLSKSQQEPKEGIQIFFVYKPIDDQIYAIKRSQLSQNICNFHSIFQCYTKGDQADYQQINEAKILSRLVHHNILRLYEWWVEQNEGSYYLYMVMEYCSFPGFKFQPNDLLSFAYFYMNPMNNLEKMENIKLILVQILAALEYIHKRGLVHRNIKPENVFVTITITGELQVRLADFDQGKDYSELKLIKTILEEQKKHVDQQQQQLQPQSTQLFSKGSQENSFDDEFYGIGVLILHLVLTFPGEPKNRNHYAKTFSVSDPDDVCPLFDSWATKLVRNRHPDFSFGNFKAILDLAKNLMTNQIKEHSQISTIIEAL